MEAAERLEAATGYAALWIAKGIGPKFVYSAATPAPSGREANALSSPARDFHITITFTQAGAAHFDQAKAFAEGRAEKFEPEMVSGLTRYRASFSKTPAGADAALQLLAYLAGGSAVYFVHANGRLLDTAKAIEVLNCYVNASATDDTEGYCDASFDHHPLPCTLLVAPSRDPDFFDGDKQQVARHIKAAAYRAECEWCPNFALALERTIKKMA
jgi:hypothetical protein